VDVERPCGSAIDFEKIGSIRTMRTGTLSRKQSEELLRALKTRFEKNMNRHQGLEWAKVQARLEANPGALWSLNEMERTGGEPDAVGHDKQTGEYIFYDCSGKSPKGRRSIATTVQRWTREKKTNQKVTRLIWQRPWVLSF
jgi:hypothetical protein